MKTIKKLAVAASLLGMCATANAAQNYYDVTSGNGNGLRFWSSNSYKIHMGNADEYHFGPVQDYSIKMNMNNDSQGDRGWTWGVSGLKPVAALSMKGEMQLQESLLIGGDESVYAGYATPTTRISQNQIVCRAAGSYGNTATLTNEMLNIRVIAPAGGLPSTKVALGYIDITNPTSRLILANYTSSYSKIGYSIENTSNVFRIKNYENGNTFLKITKNSNGTGIVAVDGRLEAEEIEVKNVGADFVFAEDYNLRSLDEVEAFIKENKHLPEIAPAAETEQGVEVGAFTEQLLMKVEELTLYMIEMKKENEAMKAEIANLKK